MMKRILQEPRIPITPKPPRLPAPRPSVPEQLSVPQAAALIGLSRIAVFKRIKAGSLKAKKIGRNYVIELDDLINWVGIDFRR